MNKYSGLSDQDLVTLAVDKAEVLKRLAKGARLTRLSGLQYVSFSDVADEYKDIMTEFLGRSS